MLLKSKKYLKYTNAALVSPAFLRFFLGLIILNICTFASPAFSKKQYTVAMITWRGETEAERGFMEGLRKSNYMISFKKYHANQDRGHLYNIITRIQKNSVDLIYVFGTTATQTVLSRIKDMPVVFNIVSRPVESGIIASWQSSGNNSTGASNKVPIRYQLRALKKVINFSKLGIIYNPREQNSVIQRDIARGLEGTLKFKLKEYRISRRSDISKVLPFMKGDVDAAYLPADSMTKSLGKEIMERVNKFKIPSLCAIENMVLKDGGLLGLVPNYYQLGRLAAEKAIQIFQGKKPTEIPTSTLNYFHMLVNMNTAKKIGVQIPVSLMVMADKIVR